MYDIMMNNTFKKKFKFLGRTEILYFPVCALIRA